MSTRTDYSIVGGGGRGYVNVGGWNTTLTSRNTQQMETPGIKRREGANVYIYGLQGGQSIAGSGYYVKLAAPATDLYTDAVVSPIVFTALGAGTVIAPIWKGISVCTCDTNTYGWYFIEGITSLTIATASTSATVGTPIMVAPASVNKVVGGSVGTAQGIALTTIACDITGQAYVKLM